MQRLSVRRAALVAIVLASAIAGAAILLADPVSPVTITDVDTPDPVASGAQITHSITIVNTGGAKITNVVMSDQLNGVGGIGVPPQLQIASSRGSCAQSGTLVTCNGGQIEGNGLWTISIRGLVTASNGTVLNNTISVTGTKSAQNFTTTNTATTLVSNGGGSNLPELSINKTGPTSVAISSPMTYTLTVNNTGTQNATGVRVVDTVPAGLTGISASGTSLFVCGVAGLTVTCDQGAVNQGSNATITINATAPATLGSITNTAVVDPDNTIFESNELNNTSALVNTQVIDVPGTAPLGINITDDPAVITGAGPSDPVVPGALLTYKILATNNAATRADDVVIVLGTQSLEASSVIVSQVVTNGAVGTGGGCTNVSPQARCLVRTLNPGGTILMTVSGYVIGSAGSFIIGTATVTGNIKNKGVTNTDTELTTVMPQYDLTITKADSPDPVCAASWPGPGYPAGPGAPAGPDYPGGNTCQGGLKYSFVIGNSGIVGATNVVVRDPLPAGMIFDHVVALTNTGGFGCTYNTGTNVVTCTGGSIPGQSIRTLEFIVVAPSGLGQITNTVTVDPNNAIFEADESNNTFTQTTQIATGIDLTVSKHSNHEANFVATKGTLTYTIKVSNLGTQDATNIQVRDTLPADSVFRDAVSDPLHGFSCSQSGGVVDCITGHIQGTESMNYPNLAGTNVDTATITIRVLATAYEQPAMHNEVRVDPLNQIGEANENNNLAVQNTQVKSGGFTSDAFNELTISKSQTNPLPATNTARNALVTYIVKVGNDGTDPAVGVKVRDTLPAGAKYYQASGTNSFLCQQQVIGFVDCIGGQVAANTSLLSPAAATITIKAFAPDTPGEYTNQVEVDPDHTIAEGNEFNNNASADTTVKNAGTGSFNDLAISFQLAPASTGSTTPLGAITYKLDVFNYGTDAALNVSVRDVLPAGVTFVSAGDAAPGAGAFTCSESEGIVDCFGATIPGIGTTMPPLPPGQRTILINVTAPNAIILLTNVAIADPNNAIPEGDETNNTATFPTSVQSAINLSIRKTGPTSSSQSQPGEYVITMKNNKSGDGQRAEDVVMRDPLPVGLIPLAAEIDPGQENNWACQIAQNPINLVECVGDLDPDQTVTVRIAVFMTAESGKSLDNEACIDPANVIPEFGMGENDNCSTWTTLIVPKSPNLFLNKSASPSAVTPGTELVYTLLLQNNGDASAASPVTITDSLPSTVTFIDANGTDGWTCSFAAPTVTCHDAGGGLGIGATTTITIRTNVNPGVTLPITNAANATSPATTTDPGAVSETADHLSDNTATVTTSVTGSGFDLVLSVLTDNPDPVSPGQVLKYTAVAINAGTEDAANVKIAIHLPSAGVLLLNADGTNGFNCAAPVSNVIACTGDLPGGGDTTITVGLATLLSLVPPTDLSVTATIDPTDVAHPSGFFIESNEGNNSATEVTTVTGSACVGCVDLVATELVASPGYTGFGTTTQTFTAQVVNVGDTATALNPASEVLVQLLISAQTGSFSVGTLTLSDPAFAPLCAIVTTPLVPGPNVPPFTEVAVNCKGNLGPAQGLTLTLPVTSVTGDMLAYVYADPSDLINLTTTPQEFTEINNILVVTVIHF